jgi:hypothetical protein
MPLKSEEATDYLCISGPPDAPAITHNPSSREETMMKQIAKVLIIRAILFFLALYLAAALAKASPHPSARSARAQNPEVQAQSDRRKLLKNLGVGAYLWVDSKKDVREIVADVKDLGVGYVLVKGNDGTKPYMGEDTNAHIAKIARTLNKIHIKTFVWGYAYANNPQAEAQTIIAALHTEGVQGYVFDAEVEVEKPEKWKSVQAILEGVHYHRTYCPSCRHKLLGTAVHALPSRHSGLPYPILLSYVDFVSPMMYWEEMKVPVKDCVTRTYQDWLKWEEQNHLSVPLVPLGQVSPSKAGGIKSGEITDFLRQTRGYYSVAFYTLDSQYCGAAQRKELSTAIKQYKPYKPGK